MATSSPAVPNPATVHSLSCLRAQYTPFVLVLLETSPPHLAPASSREPLLRKRDREHNVSFPKPPNSSNFPSLAFQISWQSEEGEAQDRPGAPLSPNKQQVPKLMRIVWATC